MQLLFYEFYLYSLVLHTADSVSQLPNKHSPLAESKSPINKPHTAKIHEEQNLSPRECNKEGKKGTIFGLDKSSYDSICHQSPALGTSSSGDTPLSLSAVSNQSSGVWLTLPTESQGLSKPWSSSYGQDVENSPPCGRKRKYSHSSNASPDSNAPVKKLPRCESPTQMCGNVYVTSGCADNPSSVPFSPPLSSEEFSNSNRKRRSTYTLETPSGDQQLIEAERDVEQPPSKRARRETFSVSPKKIDECEKASRLPDDNKAIPGVDGSEVLSGIVDVHSEIMNLLDKRVEETSKYQKACK